MPNSKCKPPPKVRRAAIKLNGGNSKERSKAGEILANHRWKNHK